MASLCVEVSRDLEDRRDCSTPLHEPFLEPFRGDLEKKPDPRLRLDLTSVLLYSSRSQQRTWWHCGFRVNSTTVLVYWVVRDGVERGTESERFIFLRSCG